MDHGRVTEQLSIGAALELERDRGGHRTDLTVQKWDIDQITWTQATDYDGRRLLRPGEEPGPLHFAEYRVRPFAVHLSEDCNLVTDAGWNMMMAAIGSAAPTHLYSTSNGAIGTSQGGSSATTVTAAYADTNLAYTASNYWQILSANPTVGTTHSAGLVFAASFGTANANWQWMEVAVDQHTASTANASATAVMFNHIGWSTGSYTGPGTKTSAQTWNATLTITWS